MSVYTFLSDNEFSEILNTYSIGHFVRSQGIQAGIENSNYFVTTTKGDYVFTLFEKINKQELAFYIALLKTLSASGIACPQPQADTQNQIINSIKNKPFIFVSRLKGKTITQVNLNQCKAIATELAKFHTTPLSISERLPNRRGKTWRESTAKKLINKLPANDAELLSNELNSYQSLNEEDLPKGIIHADLFKDNALFEGDKLSGIIDFYDACYDIYLYDIAITVNDWCTDEKGALIKPYVAAFLENYQILRPLTEAEKKAWPIMLRIAAMRFWLSRLEDSFTPPKGNLTQRKNPKTYQLILQNHILNNYAI